MGVSMLSESPCIIILDIRTIIEKVAKSIAFLLCFDPKTVIIIIKTIINLI